jgi:hypothetical protein
MGKIIFSYLEVIKRKLLEKILKGKGTNVINNCMG